MTLEQIINLNLKLTDAIASDEFENNEMILIDLLKESENLINNYYLSFGENVKPLF
jgi:hypothetical protein